MEYSIVKIYKNTQLYMLVSDFMKEGWQNDFICRYDWWFFVKRSELWETVKFLREKKKIKYNTLTNTAIFSMIHDGEKWVEFFILKQ